MSANPAPQPSAASPSNQSTSAGPSKSAATPKRKKAASTTKATEKAQTATKKTKGKAKAKAPKSIVIPTGLVAAASDSDASEQGDTSNASKSTAAKAAIQHGSAAAQYSSTSLPGPKIHAFNGDLVQIEPTDEFIPFNFLATMPAELTAREAVELYSQICKFLDPDYWQAIIAHIQTLSSYSRAGMEAFSRFAEVAYIRTRGLYVLMCSRYNSQLRQWANSHSGAALSSKDLETSRKQLQPRGKVRDDMPRAHPPTLCLTPASPDAHTSALALSPESAPRDRRFTAHVPDTGKNKAKAPALPASSNRNLQLQASEQIATCVLAEPVRSNAPFKSTSSSRRKALPIEYTMVNQALNHADATRALSLEFGMFLAPSSFGPMSNSPYGSQFYASNAAMQQPRIMSAPPTVSTFGHAAGMGSRGMTLSGNDFTNPALTGTPAGQLPHTQVRAASSGQAGPWNPSTTYAAGLSAEHQSNAGKNTKKAASSDAAITHATPGLLFTNAFPWPTGPSMSAWSQSSMLGPRQPGATSVLPWNPNAITHSPAMQPINSVMAAQPAWHPPSGYDAVDPGAIYAPALANGSQTALTGVAYPWPHDEQANKSSLFASPSLDISNDHFDQDSGTNPHSGAAQSPSVLSQGSAHFPAQAQPQLPSGLPIQVARQIPTPAPAPAQPKFQVQESGQTPTSIAFSRMAVIDRLPAQMMKSDLLRVYVLILHLLRQLGLSHLCHTVRLIATQGAHFARHNSRRNLADRDGAGEHNWAWIIFNTAEQRNGFLHAYKEKIRSGWTPVYGIPSTEGQSYEGGLVYDIQSAESFLGLGEGGTPPAGNEYNQSTPASATAYGQSPGSHTAQEVSDAALMPPPPPPVPRHGRPVHYRAPTSQGTEHPGTGPIWVTAEGRPWPSFVAVDQTPKELGMLQDSQKASSNVVERKPGPINAMLPPFIGTNHPGTVLAALKRKRHLSEFSDSMTGPVTPAMTSLSWSGGAPGTENVSQVFPHRRKHRASRTPTASNVVQRAVSHSPSTNASQDSYFPTLTLPALSPASESQSQDVLSHPWAVYGAWPAPAASAGKTMAARMSLPVDHGSDTVNAPDVEQPYLLHRRVGSASAAVGPSSAPSASSLPPLTVNQSFDTSSVSADVVNTGHADSHPWWSSASTATGLVAQASTTPVVGPAAVARPLGGVETGRSYVAQAELPGLSLYSNVPPSQQQQQQHPSMPMPVPTSAQHTSNLMPVQLRMSSASSLIQNVAQTPSTELPPILKPITFPTPAGQTPSTPAVYGRVRSPFQLGGGGGSGPSPVISSNGELVPSSVSTSASNTVHAPAELDRHIPHSHLRSSVSGPASAFTYFAASSSHPDQHGSTTSTTTGHRQGTPRNGAGAAGEAQEQAEDGRPSAALRDAVAAAAAAAATASTAIDATTAHANGGIDVDTDATAGPINTATSGKDMPTA